MRPGQDYKLYGESRQYRNRILRFEAGAVLFLVGLVLLLFGLWELAEAAGKHDPRVPIPPDQQEGGRTAVFLIPTLKVFGAAILALIGFELGRSAKGLARRQRRQYPSPMEF